MGLFSEPGLPYFNLPYLNTTIRQRYKMELPTYVRKLYTFFMYVLKYVFLNAEMIFYSEKNTFYWTYKFKILYTIQMSLLRVLTFSKKKKVCKEKTVIYHSKVMIDFWIEELYFKRKICRYFFLAKIQLKWDIIGHFKNIKNPSINLARGFFTDTLVLSI